MLVVQLRGTEETRTPDGRPTPPPAPETRPTPDTLLPGPVTLQRQPLAPSVWALFLDHIRNDPQARLCRLSYVTSIHVLRGSHAIFVVLNLRDCSVCVPGATRSHYHVAAADHVGHRHPIFIVVAAADRKVCKEDDELRTHERVHHWDDSGTSIFCTLYGISRK